MTKPCSKGKASLSSFPFSSKISSKIVPVSPSNSPENSVSCFNVIVDNARNLVFIFKNSSAVARASLPAVCT